MTYEKIVVEWGLEVVFFLFFVIFFSWTNFRASKHASSQALEGIQSESACLNIGA